MAEVSSSNVFVDNPGNLYVPFFGRVDRIDPSGSVLTVAGANTGPALADGGRADTGVLQNVTNAVLDSEGDLFLVETGSHRIRQGRGSFCP